MREPRLSNRCAHDVADSYKSAHYRCVPYSLRYVHLRNFYICLLKKREIIARATLDRIAGR